MLPMDANMPSECNDSMMFHFAGPNFTAWMRVPEHRAWSVEVTAPGLYATHKRILQELQWKGPRGRWTLKSPGFISDLDAILDTYPDACLIWTHRDPARTIASLSSLISSLQNALLGEYPDPSRAGPRRTAAVDGGGASAVWNSASSDPRVERAMLRRPLQRSRADKSATVRRIHEQFGLEFTDEHLRRVGRAREAEQPSSHFAKHSYTPGRVRRRRRDVRDELSDYYERFGELI